jgi:hypothetical protein
MRTRSLLAVGVAGAAVVTCAALKVAGAGPELPGPPVRVALGLADPTFESCRDGAGRVRSPGGPTRRRWRVAFRFTDAVDEMRAVELRGRLYVVGGVVPTRWRERLESSRRLYSLDPATATWRREPDLPQALDHVVAVAHGGELYVVGGYEHGRPSGRLWRYTPTARRWRELASMPTPRGAAAGGVVDGRLYVAGGAGPYDDGATRAGTPQGYAAVEVYDFASGRWLAGPPLPTPRHHAGGAVVDGALHVAGGRMPRDLSLRAFERLDPRTGGWERLPPLPLDAGAVAVVAAGRDVLVVGGSDDEARWVTATTWAFDTLRQRWRRLPDLSVARHSTTAAVHDGRVYVLAGAPCAGFGWTDVVESLPLPLSG